MKTFGLIILLFIHLFTFAQEEKREVDSPVTVVQKQINAYNARDIDTFLATYSEDIKIYNLNGDIIMQGPNEMRKVYEPFFKRTPNLYCEIESRIVFGNKVIDKEKVRVKDTYLEAVAVYEVEDGKIKEVTFIYK